MTNTFILADDSNQAESIVAHLRAYGVADGAIGAVAATPEQTRSLPEPTPLERSDMKPGVKRGAAVGGATGLVAGLVAVAVPGLPVLAAGALAGFTALGAAYGAWISAILGTSVPNSEHERFATEIENGKVLLVVELGGHQRSELSREISQRFPEAEWAGTESALPKIA